MSNNLNEKLIRQFVKSVIIHEGMKKIADAESANLALFVYLENEGSTLILYKPEFYLDALKKSIANLKSHKIGFIKTTDFLIDTDGIVGWLNFGEASKTDGSCLDANVINGSAADAGFGPLLYDIAMSMSPALAPDRHSVKPAAEEVWRKYRDTRGDVSKEPFDDIKNPKTPPPEDDCRVYQGRDPLNYAYKIESSPDTFSLFQAHNEFMNEVKKLCKDGKFKPPSGNKIQDELMETGRDFFMKRYKD